MKTAEKELAQVNERFYKAFEALDIEVMGKIWGEGGDVQCGHPGWQILRGRDAVIESWRRIFENTSVIRFSLSDVAIQVHGRVGWVTLYENITSSLGDEMVSATVLTTNIFAKGPDGWRLIHHHGSPVAQPPTRLEPDPTTIH